MLKTIFGLQRYNFQLPLDYTTLTISLSNISLNKILRNHAANIQLRQFFHSISVPDLTGSYVFAKSIV